MTRLINQAACLLLLTGTFFGCAPTDSPGERKKLPKMIGGGVEWESAASFADGGVSVAPGNRGFSYGDTLVEGRRFYSVSLSGGGVDSMAMQLVKMYEPFAPGAIQILQQQGFSGVLVDLREGRGTGFRSETFLATSAFGQSAPLIFLYDAGSSARASAYIQKLHQLPGIQASARMQ
jgi:hypothetical protein